MGISDKIKKIKEAEDAFEKMLQDAKVEAERLINKAHEEADQKLQMEIAAARKEAEEFTLMAEKETEKKVNQIEIQIGNDLKNMHSEMVKKRDHIIKMVQDKIAGLDVG